MTTRSFATLLLVAAIFGTSFLFIRIAAPAFGPIALMDARVLLGGFTLLAFALLTRRKLSFGGRGWEWLLLAAINFGIPFVLVAWAELHITASLAAMFVATVPLFTALVAALWMRQPLSRSKMAGLALGFIGVVMLTGLSPVSLTPTTLLAVAAMLGMALLYGIGAVYIRQRFHHVSSMSVTTFCLLASGLLLLPFVPFTLPATTPSVAAGLSLLALALLCTSLGYALLFNLIATVGPVSTMSGAYLIPVFGTFWGALFLREPVTLGMLAAFVVVLVAVTLVTGVRLVWWRVPAAP